MATTTTTTKTKTTTTTLGAQQTQTVGRMWHVGYVIWERSSHVPVPKVATFQPCGKNVAEMWQERGIFCWAIKPSLGRLICM